MDAVRQGWNTRTRISVDLLGILKVGRFVERIEIRVSGNRRLSIIESLKDWYEEMVWQFTNKCSEKKLGWRDILWKIGRGGTMGEI